MESTIRHYIRDSKKNPFGILVASSQEGYIRIGWSLCNPKDHFDKSLGYIKAIYRMKNSAPLTHLIPEKDMAAILDRAKRYFKVGVSA